MWIQQHFTNKNSDDDNDSADTNNEWLVVARQIVASAQKSVDNGAEEKTALGGVGGDATNVDNLAEGEAF